jgi:hypothetical protein
VNPDSGIGWYGLTMKRCWFWLHKRIEVLHGLVPLGVVVILAVSHYARPENIPWD